VSVPEGANTAPSGSAGTQTRVRLPLPNDLGEEVRMEELLDYGRRASQLWEAELPSLKDPPERKPLRTRVKRKALRFAYILFVLEMFKPGEEDDIVAILDWVSAKQSRLNEAELDASLAEYRRLRDDPKHLARNRWNVYDTHLRAQQITQVRRAIRRKGYKDKGSLRPNTERRTTGEEHPSALPPILRSLVRGAHPLLSTADRVMGQLSPSDIRLLLKELIGTLELGEQVELGLRFDDILRTGIERLSREQPDNWKRKTDLEVQQERTEQ